MPAVAAPLDPWSATAIYGGDPAANQPTATVTPDHGTSSPEPFAKTLASAKGVGGNPVLIVVAMIGIAFVILQLIARER